MSKEKAAAVAVAATTATTAPVVAEADELPKTIVRRVVKEKLSELSNDGADITLHKEALIAFSESARIFIHYLSATAHDICGESKRQIINADDVLNALEEIEFSEFVEPLRSSLIEFRKKNAGKRAGLAKGKEANKKRKTDEEATIENGKDDETATGNGKDDETATENGKDDETATEYGNDDDTATENGKGDETITENGKDEDDEINEDEDEDAEQESEED